jgi:hypothetical protein
MVSTAGSKRSLPRADLEFFRVFLPYELHLAQRRMLTWGTDSDIAARVALGLVVVRLERAPGEVPEVGGEDRERIAAHVEDLLRSVLRDSDLAGRLTELEHLAVLRDVDPDQAYVAAQRFLSAAGRSEVLAGSGLQTRLGFVIYPLSSQANFPPEQWSTLLELARRLSLRGNPGGPASGLGLLRGPEMTTTNIPEADLVPLLFHDADSLVRAGILRLQRIHIMPSL